MTGSLLQRIIVLSMIFYLLALPFIYYPVTTLLKPIPILLLGLFTLRVQTYSSSRTLLLCALGFSALGDVILTLPGSFALYPGILLFMLAHYCYIRVFIKEGIFRYQRMLLFLPWGLFIVIASHYLWPYLGAMKVPVLIYISVLSCMVFCSFQVKNQLLFMVSGASFFLLSDACLAIDLFIVPNQLLIAVAIMAFYYMAQFLLVMGITKIRPVDLIKK